MIGLPAADCIAVPEMVEKKTTGGDATRNAFEMDKENKFLKNRLPVYVQRDNQA